MFKRSVEPVIADLPSKQSVDDAQVKLYAGKGIEKLAATSTGPTDPVLEKILEATFFPPAGKLLYEIKIKVGSKHNKDDSQQCTVNVWRESEGESSVSVNCHQARRRREVEISKAPVVSLPTKVSVDDPEVKKYAQKAVDRFGSPVAKDKKAIVKEIEDAVTYSQEGKLYYKIKFQIGATKCTKGSDETNCEYDPEVDDANCDLYVTSQTDKEFSLVIECSRVKRTRRDVEETEPQIADLPTKVSADDPEIKKYIQKGFDRFNRLGAWKRKPIVTEVSEVTAYPPSSKLRYMIRLKFGSTKCRLESDEQNCDYDPEVKRYDDCQIEIFRETDKEDSMNLTCATLYRTRRAVDGQSQILDLPSKPSVDDPQVKLYAGKGIEKLAATSTGPSDPVLEKILEATFFPPAGKLLYEIKIKVGSKQNKDDSQQCTVNVWRESDAEPSVAVECGQSRRRRAGEENQPKVLDLPIKLGEDNAQVKKFAELGVQKYAESSADSKTPILVKILEAYSYPPVGKLSYRIKILMGTSTCSKEEKENCQLKVDGSQKECTVKVWVGSGNQPSITIDCDN